MGSESLTTVLWETLALFDDTGEPRTTTEIAEELDLGRRATYARLERLVERNRLETKKVGANARIWWQPPAETESAVREKFESLVEAVEGYAIFTLDTDGYVRTWNSGAEEIKGYEVDEAVGEHVSTFYSDADREAGVPERNLRAAAARGSIHDAGWRVRADGSRFWASVTITAIRGGDGTLRGYTKIVRDMTERREQERRLRRERDLNERLLETAPVRLAVFGDDGSIERINSRSRRALGIDESEVSEFDIENLDLYDADGNPIRTEEHPVLRVLESEEPVSEWLVQHDGRDGDRRWVSLTVTPLFDDGGEIERVVVAGRDVTDLKRTERRLKRQRDELESELDEVFERISDGFYALDGDLQIRYINDHAAGVLGLDESAIGRNFTDAVATTDTFERALNEALESQAPVIFEDYYDTIGRWFSNAIYPSETGLSVYFREITERKKREREIERRRELLQHTERLAKTGGWETDLETGEQRWTPGLFDIHGFSADEADQRAVPTMEEYFSFVASEHKESFRRTVDRCVSEGEPYDEEIRITTKEGEDRWIQTLGVPVVEDDEVVALRGAARDVTERKKREQQLSTLIDNVPGMVYRCRNERDWPMEFVSDACTELTGYDPEALENDEIGWGEDVLVQEDRDVLWGTIQGEIDEGSAFSEIYRIETADGDRRWVSDIGRGVPDGRGDVDVVEGIVQDVTEQVERERRLERYEHIVETVADGIYVLDSDHRFTIVNRGLTEMTGYDRDELLGASAELIFGDAFVDIANEKQAELESGTIDVAVLEEDLDRADGSSLVVESRFDLFDIGDGETGRVGVVRDIGDRVEHERKLERQREQLEALNSLNEVVRRITETVVDQSTREEIEAAVCEQLADSDSYLFAWIGDADAATQTVRLRTEAGVEGYLDEITISVDPDDDRSSGPTGRAFRTGEMQTTRDIDSDPRHDPWRDHIEPYGFRSSAAIPIEYEGTVYGVLNVYADRPRAFEGPEGEVIAQLGEVVGHAIAAAERKQALMSDELVELEFQIRDVFTALGTSVEPAGRIELDRTVPITDEEFLVYGTATPEALDNVRALVETLPHWDAVTVRSAGDPTRFELRVTDPPVLSVVASLGGYIEQFLIEDDTLTMTIHLAPSVDVQRVADVVTERYPTGEVLRRRQITRSRDDPYSLQRHLATELTERQRVALEAAYQAGFFEWPRDVTGEEVAESMGVAPPTFHHHLRKAERKVFEMLLSK